jgi:hypothetical protein
MTHLSWYEQASFDTYEDICKWFKTARSAARGKPYGRWARVYQDNDKSFRVTVHKVDCLRVTPENKVMFLQDATGIREINNTLSTNLYRLLPVFIVRMGKLRYKVESLATIKAKMEMDSNTHVWRSTQEGVEVFNGLTLDLATGKFDNPKKDLSDRVDSDKRKKWLALLRGFKRGIKVRLKLGAFDKYIRDSEGYSGIKWSEPQNIAMLTKAIEEQSFSEELLKVFVNSTHRWYNVNNFKAQHVADNIEHILNDNSILLRKEFGVFTDEDGET